MTDPEPSLAMRSFARGSFKIELWPLPGGMDSAYDAFYLQALESLIQWPDFDAAVETFLGTRPDSVAMDHFFQNATGVWQLYVERGAYQRADGFWEGVLDAVVRAEGKGGGPVHKSAGYYYWGWNSLQCGDVERGLALIHEALAEDRRTYSAQWPSTPSAAIVALGEGSHPASWWVGAQIIAIDRGLELAKAKLRVADLRKRFFHVTDPANTFLFLQAHASLLRMIGTPAAHRENGFVGRILLGHFLNMAVALEKACAAKSGSSGLFMDQAVCLSKKLGGKLHLPVPKTGGLIGAANINKKQKANANDTLTDLLDGKATYDDGSPIAGIDLPLSIAYVLRNVGAHHSDAPKVVSDRPDELRVAMLVALGLCVEAYY
jgi:hypothetical protein